MLSRKRARLAIMVICGGLLLCVLAFVLWWEWMFYVGVLALVGGMWIPTLRCPHCKKFFMTGTWEIKFHWDRADEGECPKCGKLLLYDDQKKSQQ